MTSGAAIKQAILDAMAEHPEIFNVGHPWLQLFVECVANGVYAEMQKLEDIGGTSTNPPATAHR